MLTNIIFERSRHAPKKLFKVNVRQTAKSRAETKGAVKHGRFDSHVSIIFPFCFVFIFWSTGLHRLVMLMFSMSFDRKKSEVWMLQYLFVGGLSSFWPVIINSIFYNFPITFHPSCSPFIFLARFWFLAASFLCLVPHFVKMKDVWSAAEVAHKLTSGHESKILFWTSTVQFLPRLFIIIFIYVMAPLWLLLKLQCLNIWNNMNNDICSGHWSTPN